MTCTRAALPIPENAGRSDSQVSLLLERLEEMQAWDLADRVMDLLAGCSPKDFSPCDNRQCTKGSLERLQEKIRAKMD